jgi:hypothetical protein
MSQLPQADSFRWVHSSDGYIRPSPYMWHSFWLAIPFQTRTTWDAKGEHKSRLFDFFGSSQP